MLISSIVIEIKILLMDQFLDPFVRHIVQFEFILDFSLFSCALKIKPAQGVTLHFICSTVKELRGEHRLRTFENSMLKIPGLKMDQIIGEWIKLHNDELHNFDSFPNIITKIRPRRINWAGHVAHLGGVGKMHIGFRWDDMI
jgi:hypothetical protein